jgi:hypothetical protein
MSGKQPLNPYIVLALAILAPGAGHVAAGAPQRGLGFAFFSLLLALICWHTTSPDISFIGRSAIGRLIWALSIPAAYPVARKRNEEWRHGQRVASRENSLHAS